MQGNSVQGNQMAATTLDWVDLCGLSVPECAEPLLLLRLDRKSEHNKQNVLILATNAPYFLGELYQLNPHG